MNVTIDTDTYDGMQAVFTYELCRSIRDALKREGIEGDKLKTLVGSVAFAVTTILDGSEQIDPKAGVPHVLLKSDKASLEYISPYGTSFMHEYVFGNVDELFESGSE